MTMLSISQTDLSKLNKQLQRVNLQPQQGVLVEPDKGKDLLVKKKERQANNNSQL